MSSRVQAPVEALWSAPCARFRSLAVVGALALVGTACGSERRRRLDERRHHRRREHRRGRHDRCPTPPATTKSATAAAGTVGVDASQLASESEVQSLIDEAFGGGVGRRPPAEIAQEAYKMYANRSPPRRRR